MKLPLQPLKDQNAVMLVGFALTWLLEDVPLRTTAGAETAEAAEAQLRTAA
jgi:hypothetical protein